MGNPRFITSQSSERVKGARKISKISAQREMLGKWSVPAPELLLGKTLSDGCYDFHPTLPPGHLEDTSTYATVTVFDQLASPEQTLWQNRCRYTSDEAL